MLTETFKKSIAAALCRIGGVTAGYAAKLAEMGFDDTKLLCRLMVYHEQVAAEQQTDNQRQAILYDSPAGFGDDTLWQEIIGQGRERFNKYDGFTKGFRTNPSGASIVRIGRELHMTIDEINNVLTSYDLQTISFHRTDDLLFRYAGAKGWPYQRFVAELGYDNRAQGALPELTGENDNWDSAVATRRNRHYLQQLCDAVEPWSEHPYPTIIEVFQDSERNASGAPRRAMMRLLSWFSADGYHAYSAEDQHQYARSRRGRGASVFHMLHEAAGMQKLELEAADVRMVIKCVMKTIDAMMKMANLSEKRRKTTRKKIDDYKWREEAQQIITSAVSLELRKRIADETERKRFTCNVDDILGILREGQALQDSGTKDMDVRESCIKFQIVRNTLYRLLIACDEMNVRRHMVSKITETLLPAFGQLVEPFTEERVREQLGKVFWLKKHNERVSEPSRGFLILLAVYTYGFSLTHDMSVDGVRQVISETLNYSGYLPLGSSKFDKMIVALVEESVDRFVSASRPADRESNWQDAVRAAWKHLAGQYSPRELAQMRITSLTSGNWNYNMLSTHGGKK